MFPRLAIIANPIEFYRRIGDVFWHSFLTFLFDSLGVEDGKEFTNVINILCQQISSYHMQVVYEWIKSISRLLASSNFITLNPNFKISFYKCP